MYPNPTNRWIILASASRSTSKLSPDPASRIRNWSYISIQPSMNTRVIAFWSLFWTKHIFFSWFSAACRWSIPAKRRNGWVRPDGQWLWVYQSVCEFNTRYSHALWDYSNQTGNSTQAHLTVSPHHNGKVERSHREDQKRFYSTHRFWSLADFGGQLAAHQSRRNSRPMCPHRWLSPKQKLSSFTFQDHWQTYMNWWN